MTSFIYSKLRKASLWPIILTVFSNTPKQQIFTEAF